MRVSYDGMGDDENGQVHQRYGYLTITVALQNELIVTNAQAGGGLGQIQDPISHARTADLPVE